MQFGTKNTKKKNTFQCEAISICFNFFFGDVIIIKCLENVYRVIRLVIDEK